MILLESVYSSSSTGMLLVVAYATLCLRSSAELMSRDASYAEVDTFYLRIGFGSYSGRDISFCRGNGGWTYKLNIE